MKNKKYSRIVRLLLSIGLFIQSFPFLFSGYFRISNFFNGFFCGFGLMLIVSAFIKLQNETRQAKLCSPN